MRANCYEGGASNAIEVGYNKQHSSAMLDRTLVVGEKMLTCAKTRDYQPAQRYTAVLSGGHSRVAIKAKE